MQQKVKLERHVYSPEQNKLYMANTVFSVPGAKNIGEARRMVFPKLPRSGLYAEVKVVYDAEKSWLNRTYTGFINHLSPSQYSPIIELGKYLQLKKQSLAQGGRLVVKLKLIG